MDTKKVWFVTGASKGFGLIMVKKLLQAGHQVAATSRNIADLDNEIGEKSANFLPLQVDLVNEQSVASSIAETINTFGKIDVIINNAGYGQLGTLEELSDDETRKNFDVNVFGSLNVIRHIMPHFRANQSGQIFNISSIGGFMGAFAGWGVYCATKFAVAGFTEALAVEAKSHGISATVVYPGYFRTNFLVKGSLALPQNPIAEYKEARESETMHEQQISGNQPGDPEKAADVLIEVAKNANPPVHLFLGQDAYNMANAKLELIQNDLDTYKVLGTSTNF